jgi:hypothetical protein
MLALEGKITCDSFPPWWDDVVSDELVLVQDGKILGASFPPRGMMLSEMSSFLCKRES